MSIIKIENLSKKYILSHSKAATGMYKYNSLRDSLAHTFRGIGHRILHPLSPNLETTDIEEFWALKDINLEIEQGDKVGIIGRNGAGKSTLLKILSRITEPTSGRITMNGRVASLLEVGTGFHPELSGRENIYLNGAVLGMTRKEIKKKFDEIVDFSGVEKFLDTPVKRYSSGMYVRLAFAVAAHLDPEILLIDEVLAVGDAEFQKKCLGKMDEVSKQGRTILFVSHNMAAIQQLCTNGFLLERGSIVKSGSIFTVVQHYFSSGIKTKEKPDITKYRNYDTSNSAICIDSVYIKGFENETPKIDMNQIPTIVVKVLAKRKIVKANISLALYNPEGIKTDLAFSCDDNFYLNCEEGYYEIEFTQTYFSLPPGKYTIGVGINQSYNTVAWDGISYYPIFEIENCNNVLQWDFRPWAVHHSQNNKWVIAKSAI